MLRTGDFSRVDLLIKVARMYYDEQLTQQDIAERLGLSRPGVSRLLNEARRRNVVRISIVSPYEDESRLSGTMMSRFKLDDVVVVPAATTDPAAVKESIGAVGADLLDRVLPNGQVLAVSGGTTVLALADHLNPSKMREVSVVPIIGGMGQVGGGWHSNDIARKVGNAFSGRYYLLNAPAVVASSEVRDLFMREPSIQRTLDLGKKAQVAVVGIGALSPDSTMVQPGFFSASELMSLSDLGVVGNIGVDFFDASGRIVTTPLDARLIGVSLLELGKDTRIIAVAGGASKVEAIRGALQGGLVQMLVTDVQTAKLICGE